MSPSSWSEIAANSSGTPLKFAAAPPEARTLTAELLNFQAKITTAANDTYGAWRQGTHDDTVLGLAIALWFAERYIDPTDLVAWA